MATVQLPTRMADRRLTVRARELGLFCESLELDVAPLHVLVQACPKVRQVGLPSVLVQAAELIARQTHRLLLTLASNRINKSFRFRSSAPILTRRKGLCFSLLAPAGAGGGLTRPIPGAPKTFGSRMGEERDDEGWLKA